VLEDVTGKPMQAFLVFAHAIRELKKHLLAQLKNAITGAKDNDVLFVLTVPAIWDERAKLFMRKAAIKVHVNIHMNEKLCSFQQGSIVNKSVDS
jgi:hypothetical protein